MELSSDLISQFSKITNDNKSEKKDTTLYGTVVNVIDNGDDTKTYYVKMDGSSVETPVITTVELNEGDRVLVSVKNHTATVTGNTTNIALGKMTEGNLRSEISQTAEKITLSAEKLEGDIATAKAEFTVEAGKIRADMTAQGDELQRLIGENSDEITDLDKRMTSAETEIIAIPGRVESTVSGKYATIETTDDLNSRISKAESSIVQLPTSITSTIKATYIDPIEGEQEKFSKFQQTVEGFSFMGNGGTVKISGGDINLTGAISFSDLTDSTSVQRQINTANNNASDALEAAGNAEEAADGVLTTVNGITIKEGSKTYLDGEMIYSNSIYADAMHLGGALTVYKTLYGSTVGGYLGYDSGFNSTSGIGIRDSTEVNQVVCTNSAARLSSGDPTSSSNYSQFIADDGYAYIEGSTAIILEIDGTSYVALGDHGTYGSLRPHANAPTMHLGNTSYRWGGVYATNGEIQTSDRNYKHDIEDLPEKYIIMFDSIRPRRFKMDEGTSGRYHVGYIAQEVEEAMIKAGIDSQEFGGFVRDKDADGNDICMLRYGEFDGVRDAKIKQLESQLVEAYAMISELKTRLDNLEAKEVS